MKGNQESMLYTTNATVAALNHVSGFDPLKFLRRTTSRKTGEDVMRLDLRYKKLWFRLACPTGRLKLNALRITEKMAIFEAKVYRDREDAEPLSSYVANWTQRPVGCMWRLRRRKRWIRRSPMRALASSLLTWAVNPRNTAARCQRAQKQRLQSLFR